MPVAFQLGEMVIDPTKLAAFAKGGTGPVLRDLMRRGTNVQVAARARVRKRTRKLEKSIVKRANVDARGPVVYVVTSVDYARYENDGTRPHVITAVNKKVLRFPGRGGQLVFVKQVHHPGTTGSHFLTLALQAARD